MNKKIKILLIAGQFYPDIAGSAVATYFIAESLALRGYEATVIIDSLSKSALEKRPHKFKAEYVDNYKKCMVGDIGFKKVTEDVYSIIKRSKCDIIHVYSYLPMLILSLFRDSLNTPVVFTFWSTPFKLERSIGFYRKSILDMQLSTAIIKMEKYDLMILGSRSNYNSAIAQGANKRKTYMAYHGINMPEFDRYLRESSKIDITEYIGENLKPGEILLMLPGRITKRKGVSETIDAFILVNKKHPCKLLLTGMIKPYDQEYADELLLKISKLNVNDKILIPKKIIYRDVLAAFYKRANVVITPSYFEGLGFTAIEALYSARPLVATNVQGLNEVVINNKNGLLVPPRDARRLAEAIIALLEDKKLAMRLSSAGPDSVKIFNMENFVDFLIKKYTILLTK